MPGSVMVAHQNLGLTVEVRILTGQFDFAKGKIKQRIENRKLKIERIRFRFGQISIIDFQEKKMAFIFENLDVYKKAVDLAEKISGITESFSRGNYYLSDQLNRAVLSISTNIAEGNGRYHKADRTNFFRIARGSAFECVPLLEICQRKKLIEENLHRELKIQIEDICKMLSGLMR